jgi:hypothetical protein
MRVELYQLQICHDELNFGEKFGKLNRAHSEVMTGWILQRVLMPSPPIAIPTIDPLPIQHQHVIYDPLRIFRYTSTKQCWVIGNRILIVLAVRPKVWTPWM